MASRVGIPSRGYVGKLFAAQFGADLKRRGRRAVAVAEDTAEAAALLVHVERALALFAIEFENRLLATKETQDRAALFQYDAVRIDGFDVVVDVLNHVGGSGIRRVAGITHRVVHDILGFGVRPALLVHAEGKVLTVDRLTGHERGIRRVYRPGEGRSDGD
jgi:hypothetical protein